MRFFDKIGEENYNDNALRRPAHAYTDNLGTVMENFKAHGSYTIDEDLSISEPLKLNQPINDQLDLIYKLTSNENYNNRLLSTQKIGAKGRGVYDANKDFYKSAETSQLILELQKKYPDAGLKSYEQMMDEVGKDLAEKRQHLATLSARSQGGSRALGTITGMGAYMLDPAIVATIPFSGGWSTGRGIFGNMKRSFVIEAGLAGMAETAITPYVYEWKQEIGSPFELKDAVIRIMTASIGAGVIRSGASVTIDLAQLTKATIMLRKQGKTVEADVLDTYADLVKDAPTVREIVEPVKPKLSTKEALKIEKEAKKAWQAKKDELQQKAYDDGRRMNTDDEFDEIELLRLEWLKKEVDYFLIKLTKQTDKNEIAKLEKHIQDLVNNINKRAERNLVNAKFEPYKLKQPSKGETLSAQDKHIIAQSKVEEDLVAGRVLDQDELDALNYRGSHTSPEPDAEYKTSLDDFSDIFPDKATSPNFKKYYGMGGEYAKADIETIKVMKAAMGKPDAEITIYRAVPKGTKDINAGDWVSTSKDYATKHGELYIDEGFEIISKKVKAKEIHSAGDLHEWGYHPAKKLEPANIAETHQRLVPAMREAMAYKSAEEWLRKGGPSWDALNEAAFGFSEKSLKRLSPDALRIKWKEDIKNVKLEIEESGKTREEWASSVSLKKPIDVVFENGKLFVDDGHHRYTAAKILNKDLKINLEMKDKPIAKLTGKKDYNYDEFVRGLWKEAQDGASPALKPEKGKPVRLQDLNDIEVAKVELDFKTKQKELNLTPGQYRKAAQTPQRQIVTIGKELEDAMGESIAFLNPGIKDLLKIKNKIKHKGYDGTGDLTDVVRAGFAVKEASDMPQIIEKISKRYEILDEGIVVNAAGYIDQKILVRFDNGLVGEIQLWEPHILAAKEGADFVRDVFPKHLQEYVSDMDIPLRKDSGHDIYERQRSLLEGGKVKPGKGEEFKALEKSQKDLYSYANRFSKTSWNDALESGRPESRISNGEIISHSPGSDDVRINQPSSKPSDGSTVTAGRPSQLKYAETSLKSNAAINKSSTDIIPKDTDSIKLNDQLKDTGLDLDDPYLNELSIKEQQLVDDLLADGDIDIPSGVRIDADGKEVVEFRSAKEALEELDAEHKAVDDMFRCMKGAA